MTHKCPVEPCEDCWEEAKAVTLLLLCLGMLIGTLLLAGCASIQTSDCARDAGGRWTCHERSPK